MEVRGLGCLGIRTRRFEETASFFREVMGRRLRGRSATWSGSGSSTGRRWRCGAQRTSSTTSSVPSSTGGAAWSSFRGPEGDVYEIIEKES
jgi:catechol 2,3-dioxygenase-like lactoylglutathione lyase family enzyme